MIKAFNTISSNNLHLLKNLQLMNEIHLEFCWLKKKPFVFGLYKATFVKYPLYHRKVIIFKINGSLIKKHYSSNSMNQTITLECVISKNKFLLTSPTNPKGITVY